MAWRDFWPEMQGGERERDGGTEKEGGRRKEGKGRERGNEGERGRVIINSERGQFVRKRGGHKCPEKILLAEYLWSPL